jgi:hypothetical protein
VILRSVQRARQAGPQDFDAVSVPKEMTVKETIWPIAPDFAAEDEQKMKADHIQTTGGPEVPVLRELVLETGGVRLDRDAIVSGGPA